MPDQDERMEQLLKTTPETEIIYRCDKDGKTTLVVRGEGLAIMFGVLNILHSFSTSSGRSFTDLITDLQRMHPMFEKVVRTISEKKNSKTYKNFTENGGNV